MHTCPIAFILLIDWSLNLSWSHELQYIYMVRLQCNLQLFSAACQTLSLSEVALLNLRYFFFNYIRIVISRINCGWILMKCFSYHKFVTEASIVIVYCYPAVPSSGPLTEVLHVRRLWSFNWGFYWLFVTKHVLIGDLHKHLWLPF
jgi:hypothetical protein